MVMVFAVKKQEIFLKRIFRAGLRSVLTFAHCETPREISFA